MSSAETEEEEEGEDEFFDAPDEDLEEPDTAQQQRLPWNQPEGRLKPCGTLRLLETGDRLYIPVTQVSLRLRTIQNVFILLQRLW